MALFIFILFSSVMVRPFVCWLLSAGFCVHNRCIVYAVHPKYYIHSYCLFSIFELDAAHPIISYGHIHVFSLGRIYIRNAR